MRSFAQFAVAAKASQVSARGPDVIHTVRASLNAVGVMDKRVRHIPKGTQCAPQMTKLALMSTPLESNCIVESKSNDALGTVIMNSSFSMGAVVQDHGFRSSPVLSSPHSIK